MSKWGVLGVEVGVILVFIVVSRRVDK